MTSNHLESKLRRAINDAISATLSSSPAVLAGYICHEHADLVAELYEAWGRERLIARCASFAQLGKHNPMKRGRPTIQHPDQMRLPGWEDIPYWIYLEPSDGDKRGKRVALPDATLENLKQRRALLQGQYSDELPALQKLISIMGPYDRAEPGITVSDALKRQAATKRA